MKIEKTKTYSNGKVETKKYESVDELRKDKERIEDPTHSYTYKYNELGLEISCERDGKEYYSLYYNISDDFCVRPENKIKEIKRYDKDHNLRYHDIYNEYGCIYHNMVTSNGVDNFTSTVYDSKGKKVLDVIRNLKEPNKKECMLTRYIYNDKDQLIEKNSTNYNTHMIYDEKGNIINTISKIGKNVYQSKCKYYDNGVLRSTEEYINDTLIEITKYNECSAITYSRINNDDGTIVEEIYEYDNDNNCIYQKTEEGESKFYYDKYKRLSSEECLSNDTTAKYFYIENTNLMTRQEFKDNFYIEKEYDDNFNMISYTTKEKDKINLQTIYKYDENNNIIHKENLLRSNKTGKLEQKFVSNRIYDNKGNLIKVETISNGKKYIEEYKYNDKGDKIYSKYDDKVEYTEYIYF